MSERPKIKRYCYIEEYTDDEVKELFQPGKIYYRYICDELRHMYKIKSIKWIENNTTGIDGQVEFDVFHIDGDLRLDGSESVHYLRRLETHVPADPEEWITAMLCGKWEPDLEDNIHILEEGEKDVSDEG